MDSGDIEGLGKIYDKSGNLIMQKDERLFLVIPKGIFCIHSDKIRTYQEEYQKYSDNWWSIYFTNKRIIGIRKPSLPKTWHKGLLDAGFAVNIPYEAYYNEKQAQKKGAFIFNEVYLNEIKSMETSLDVIGLYIDYKNERTLCLLGVQNSLQREKIEKILQQLNISHKVDKYYRESFVNHIFKKFNFSDTNGLNTTYDINGNPILEHDEQIVEYIQTSPTITSYLGQKEIALEAKIGTLFKTDKRLIFIRRYYDGERGIYYPIPKGTYIYFWFNPIDADKIRMEGNDLVFEFTHRYRYFWKRNMKVYFPINEIKYILGEYL